MGVEIQNHVLIRYTEEPDITEITVPEEVTEIKARAFEDCQNLKSVYIPDTVTRIGEYAFYNCAQLEEVRLPKKLTCIEVETFSECCSLKHIIIPDCVEKIGGSAFFDTDISEITIPASVEVIESCAIGNRLKLEDMNFYFLHNQKKTKIIVKGMWINYAPEYKLMEFLVNPCPENFSQLDAEYKLQVALSYYDTDEQISKYLKRMIKKAVSLAIDTDDTVLLNELLQTGFITKKNIDSMIDYAIQHMQKTGNEECHMMLMYEKNFRL